eukprot:scaffold48376_cov59-Phaeocystis_antarctica.AAC.2
MRVEESAPPSSEARPLASTTGWVAAHSASRPHQARAQYSCHGSARYWVRCEVHTAGYSHPAGSGSRMGVRIMSQLPMSLPIWRRSFFVHSSLFCERGASWSRQHQSIHTATSTPRGSGACTLPRTPPRSASSAATMSACLLLFSSSGCALSAPPMDEGRAGREVCAVAAKVGVALSRALVLVLGLRAKAGQPAVCLELRERHEAGGHLAAGRRLEGICAPRLQTAPPLERAPPERLRLALTFGGGRRGSLQRCVGVRLDGPRHWRAARARRGRRGGRGRRAGE